MRSLVFTALVLATASWAQETPRPRGRLSPEELAAQVDQAGSRLKTAETNLVIVETQYAKRRDPTKDEALLARFSDGELRYLLNDFSSAAVVFYDLVADQNFKQSPRYEDALYYLSDSLVQSDNAIVAKVYLKELLARKGKHYREALLRYIEVAGKTNDYSDIDEYIEAARVGGGELPPELAYTYGKYNFRRTDLPLTDKLVRVRAALTPLAAAPSGRYRLQAAYFLAVAFVQEGKYDQAIEQFKRITQQRATEKADVGVKELAWMSLGRLYYETSRFNDAIDAYQQISQNSDYFVDSLYEVAWVRVKNNEFEAAKNATDILLLVSPDSTVAPEAQILQGNLLAKLKRWNDATDAYNAVINTYGPVRDEVDALLTVNKDPVAYFDNLLAKNERGQSVSELLPPVARKWATTQREVADAVSMVNDLEVGRRNVTEANEIAARILKALDERGLETFPELQEGYTRADAVDSALTEVDEALTRVERYALQNFLTAEQQAELDRLKAEQAQLQPKFQELPTSEQDVLERKKRMQERVDQVEKDAFASDTEIQALLAQIAATEKYTDDTRRERTDNAEDEKNFRKALEFERTSLLGLEKQVSEIRQKLQDERELANAMLGGENEIRRRYSDNLSRQQQILEAAGAKAGPEIQQVLMRVGMVRQVQHSLKGRVDLAKSQLRTQVTARRDQIRHNVQTELTLLHGYGGDVDKYSGDARQLVGRIAFDSFKRVKQQFYDLVLKADVGVVDVAFTRKQDKTQQIQKLSSDKDRDLKRLDDEFKEVLKEVD